MTSLLDIPEHRHAPLQALRERLLGVRRVLLTTHVNADGDGAGCEVAVASWLASHGVTATIVNPTPFPQQFRFLLDEQIALADWGQPAASGAARDAELMFVLDTAEPSRIGPLADAVPRERTLVLDHHQPSVGTISEHGLFDPSAAATGELVYDLLRLDDAPAPHLSLLGIYVAVVTDTGSFRFSNTTPRAHAIAADLIGRGIDPEWVYRKLYATVPRHRVELLREALGTLRTDGGLAWIVVGNQLIERLGATAEDLDGLVEYARTLEGTEIALLFRELPDGRTKVSLRSNGEADVNRIARQFGGGGHVKASGATLDAPPHLAVEQVVAVARRAAGVGR